MNKTPGYETRDVDIRRVSWMAVALMLVVVVSLVVMEWTFNVLDDREASNQPAPANLTGGDATGQLPPAPRLQTSPLADLRVMRAEEEAALTGYGWVDQQAGIARIPIEDAMRILVENEALDMRKDDVTP